MKAKYLILPLVFFSFLLASLPAFAAPTIDTIDGDMGYEEWNGYSANEDTGDNWYVGPGYGGQEYDVEKLGLFIQDDVLYLGLQTGFEINYKEDGLDPGDIAIDVGSDGTYEFALRFSDDGSNSSFLNQSSVTTNTVYNASLDIFSIDNNSEWDTGYTGFSSASPFKLYGGTEIGQSDVAAYYREGGSSYDPYRNTLEAAIDFTTLTERLADLGQSTTGDQFNVSLHWTMECGNDYLTQSYIYNSPPNNDPPGSPVPEPQTFLMFGIGLIGLGALGRKKQKKE